MNEAEIYVRLKEVFTDVFDEEINLTPDLTAKDVDGWDSITHLRLIMTVERTFKIKFSTTEIGAFQKLGDLAACIREKT